MLKYVDTVNRIVNRYARYKSPIEKEDLRQEGFLILVENKDIIKNEKHAYTIVRNRILNILERPRLEEISIDIPGVLRQAEREHVHFPDSCKSRNILELVENLPQTERNVIQYMYVEGRSLKDVSEILHTSVYQVWNIEKLALKKLKNLMENK